MLRQVILLVLVFLLTPISTVAQATPPATASQTSAAGSPENDLFYPTIATAGE